MCNILEIYDTSKKYISYSTDAEYRNILSNVFFIIFSSSENEFDDESNKILMTAMEHLFHLTKTNEIFDKLYNLACSKMFLTDTKIGQCILFSYDYFELFHSCLCYFLIENKISEDDLFVKKLINKLTEP